MSKSLKRVTRALADAGFDITPSEMAEGTRTAADAAAAIDCEIDQIAKSIIFATSPDEVVLFITAGGRQVDVTRAAALVGAGLTRADAAQIRAQTGFAIGGVSPIGLTAPVRSWFDRRLLDFAEVWPAAGTPRHVFAIDPRDLQALTQAQVADFTS
ncbi:MAG: YbaK/EbsC family protein [Pseudomonadota bacterium]